MTSSEIFRWVSLVEGGSYLLLLFVAMPLKYLAGQPEMVKVVGGVHGLLFVAFVAALLWAILSHGWKLSVFVKYFVASVVPFGFLFIEWDLKRRVADPGEDA